MPPVGRPWPSDYNYGAGDNDDNDDYGLFQHDALTQIINDEYLFRRRDEGFLEDKAIKSEHKRNCSWISDQVDL